MKRATILSLLLSCAITFGASVNGIAATAPPSQPITPSQQLALDLSQRIIVPAYDALQAATATQLHEWERGCADQAALASAYQTVADKWAYVFHWQFGPITTLLRRDRFYHWPERRNAVSKSVNAILMDDDTETFDAKRFQRISVAGQGLPALERLLYTNINLANDDRACAYGMAIAANLHRIADAATNDWRVDVLPKLNAGQDHAIFFDNSQDVINRLFTDYLTALTVIKDQKILPALGPTAARANPKRAEGWRSYRPLHTIKVNLLALQNEGTIWAAYAGTTQANRLAALFNRADARLASLTSMETAIASGAGRDTLTLFVKDLTAIQSYLRNDIAPVLGINIGFNSLDGD